jgi:hypothetical protein
LRVVLHRRRLLMAEKSLFSYMKVDGKDAGP